MKAHIPYFDFYPADFMNGVRGLSAQEVGVYTMILCMIYEENGPVERNDLRLSTYCGMRQPTFAKTIDKLIALGKFKQLEGMLSNSRAETEISNRANKLKNNSKAGKASAEKRQQKQQEISTPVEQPFNHTDTDTDTDNIKERSRSSAGENSISEPDRLYDEVLSACGLTSGKIPTYWMPPSATAEIWKWRSELGLTSEQIVEVARAQRPRHATPPNGPRALKAAMRHFASVLKAPPLTAINPTGDRHERNDSTQRHGDAASNSALRAIARAAGSF